jgi:hypothetical protein
MWVECSVSMTLQSGREVVTLKGHDDTVDSVGTSTSHLNRSRFGQ